MYSKIFCTQHSKSKITFFLRLSLFPLNLSFLYSRLFGKKTLDLAFLFQILTQSMASDESAGSDEPNPSDDGWVNPRRPLTRPILSYVPGCYKSTAGGGGGGGKESLTVVQGKRKARIFPPPPPASIVNQKFQISIYLFLWLF